MRTAWRVEAPSPARATTSRSSSADRPCRGPRRRRRGRRPGRPGPVAALPLPRERRSGVDGDVQWIRFGPAAAAGAARPGCRHLPGATQERPPASSRNRRTTNSPMPWPPGTRRPRRGRPRPPRPGRPPGRPGRRPRPRRAAVGGRVVDQVLDRLAEHGRAGLDLGLGAGPGPHGRPRATATVLAAACTPRPRRARPAASAAGPAVAEHLAGQLVQVATSARSSSASGCVEALVAEHGDRLAGDPTAAIRRRSSWASMATSSGVAGTHPGRHAEATEVVPLSLPVGVNVLPRGTRCPSEEVTNDGTAA